MPRHNYIILILFVFSGFSALVFKSVWTQYLSIVLGHAAYAQTLVICIFMAGMASGSLYVSRRIHLWKNLITKYAYVELILGVFAFSFHFVFTNSLKLSYDIFLPFLSPSMAQNYLWFFAILLIFPQTFLLGVTFPLLSSCLLRTTKDKTGKGISLLYFTNSIGAAVGVIFCSFLFLPKYGSIGSLIIAGSINVAIAIIALKFISTKQETKPIYKNSANLENNTTLKLILFATFISSAASFAYEVLYLRMLSLSLGSTIHSFEIMLCAFILGIALGAYWISKRIALITDPLKYAAKMQILMGLSAMVSLVAFEYSFYWVGELVTHLKKNNGGYILFNYGSAAISILIMLPTAFFAGTTLPLFTKKLMQSNIGESSIGKVYSWNTAGAILGVIFTVHYLLPTLGLKLSMLVACSVDILVGFYILRFKAKSDYDVRYSYASLLILVLSFSVFNHLATFNKKKLTSGVYRHGSSSSIKGESIVFYKDGKTSTVSVIENALSGTMYIGTNGKTDASIEYLSEHRITADEQTMVMLGGLPIAYVPNAKSGAVIGFGSGLSTHTLLSSNIEKVSTIEIEPQIINGAKLFGDRVKNAFEAPRSEIIIDDARAFFAKSNRKFDVIISEPSNPWISGIGNLFTIEFYGYIKDFLSQEGVFVQWVQLYEINDQLIASIIDAMTPQFKSINAYLANQNDLILIASNNVELPQPDYNILFSDKMKREFNKAGFSNSKEISIRKVANIDLLKSIATLNREYPFNSDYHQVLSLNAPRERFKKSHASSFTKLINTPLPINKFLSDPIIFEDTKPFSSIIKLSSEKNANLTLDAFKDLMESSSNVECFDLNKPKHLDKALFFIKYLPHDNISIVLQKLEQLTCESSLFEKGLYFSLLTSLKNGDSIEVVKNSSEWLKQERAKDPDLTRRVFQLGLIAATSIDTDTRNKFKTQNSSHILDNDKFIFELLNSFEKKN